MASLGHSFEDILLFSRHASSDMLLFDLAIDSASAPRRRDTLFSLGGDRVVLYSVLEEGDEDATAALEEETLSIAHKDTFVGEGLSVVRARHDDAARGDRREACARRVGREHGLSYT
jgi:hypothetical protein